MIYKRDIRYVITTIREASAQNCINNMIEQFTKRR